MNIWKDEEFNQKIGNIIEKEFFPDTEKMKVMSSLLETEADEVWELQKTAEKLMNTKCLEDTEGLDEFLHKNMSEEQVVFEKINKKNKEKFSEKYWWVELNSQDSLGMSSDQKKNSLMFQPSGIKDQGFKKPRSWVCAENTRMKNDLVALNSYIMPDISEKELIAIKLAEKSMKGSRNPSRASTPQTPSSRVSSIFPIYNYTLPSKRQREPTK
jgi:hypothetical protein